MSSLEHEEELMQQKLFNADVVRLLFKYVMRYKKYLFYAAFFVLITTVTTLFTPVLAKIIIDRHVINSGYIADLGHLTLSGDSQALAESVRKNGMVLDSSSWFIYQSTLKTYSRVFIDSLTYRGILSKDKYTPVKNLSLNSAMQEKIQSEIKSGAVRKIGDIVLIPENAKAHFTTAEMVLLRAEDLKRVTLLSLVMLILFSCQFIASYLQILSLMKLSQKAMRDLRTDLFSHILSLELSFFDKNPVGKLVNRVTNDIESLNELFSSVIVNLSQNLLIMAGVIVMMYIADPYLATVVCLSIPFLIIIILIFRSQARKAYRLIRTKIADLNTFLNENISGIRLTQIFVQEKKQFAKFRKINSEVYSANISQVTIYAIFRPLIDFFRWIALGAVIYFGTKSLIDGRLSYGLIVMFIAYVNTFFEPIGELAEKIDILQSATASGEKILSIFRSDALKEVLVENDRSSTERFYRFNGEIVFDNVWFAYTPGEWVLKGISFCVNPKTTLAVVGETGSGKSTIISLLAKFYIPQKGRITIDGVDIKEIPYEVLRRNLSIVMQDVFLFSRTVRDNIILNEPWDELRFSNVLSRTNAAYFVNRLKAGSEELVMERGVTFSAGERQLLAFSRSLYADPSVLVLDEATSNIDTHTEQLIQEAIIQGMQGRTSIAIAHRLSTVRNADTIIVLENGVVAEAGTHESLVERKGLYYELYRLQFEAV